jgi:type IV secretory pathway VirB10-like protein
MPEKPLPLVINVGTRIQAVLTDPVVTGAALAPATAKLANDVLVGDRVAIPAGTVLVGEGFATQQDDRAQVVFSAIVKDGKTLQFEGWALQEVVKGGSFTRGPG